MAEGRAQRRLAAIFAADVAGYSRLMGADEEGTLAALKAHRGELVDPTIARHAGRIVKTMGDGILAEFSSPVEAVRCAVEIQQGAAQRAHRIAENRRIAWRIGINLGDVIAEDNDLYGDGVNVATRLEGLAEAGGICVSRAVRDQVRDRLAVSFVDLGEQQVKNIARPVRCFRLIFDEYTAPVASQIASPGAETGPRLSIVVLPFANLSDDSVQGYFADGLTEDITTDLSRISGSFVISHSTAFTYKGKPIDAKVVAHELGVRYILEGSVRRLDSQVRVGAQLIDGETGAHLWAERFDHDILDLAAFQDEVTQRIAQALSLELVDAESRSSRRSRPANPDAVDLAMQAWSLLNQPANKQRFREARDILETSLGMDGQLADSLVGLAYVLVANADRGLSDSPDQDVDRAEELVNKALALEPKMAAAHRVKSWIFGYRSRLPEAIAAAEMAIALNRNDSVAHRLLALRELQAGHPERSRAVIEQAMRLSPRDPNHWGSLAILARAQIALGESEAALTNLRSAIAANPDVTFIRLYFATAYGRMGRDKEAREAIVEFLRMNPDLMAGQSMTVRTVMKAQLELAARGYYLGAVDGRIGPFSQHALAAFQRDSGITETSDLDDVTLAKLGIAPT
ncbi:MAG: adenylate/guanylate cyclase domain-containing protein [Candidatus Binataceae bacterium]